MTNIDLSRRALLQTGLVGGAAMAVGATMLAAPGVRKSALMGVSRWNDGVQRALFDAEKMAPTYGPEAISSPFPFNGFYPQGLAPRIDVGTWSFEVTGRVARPMKLTMDDLLGFEAYTQITRLICIEGWIAVGKWAGPRLRDILDAAGTDPAARYLTLTCADGYWTSIDMASARHAQTILALDFLDRPLPPAFGAPMRLRIPTKLGFKNAKHLMRIEVTNTRAGGYWEDQGYGWFAGL